MISKVILVTIVILLAAERCSEPLPVPTYPSSYGNPGIAHHKAFGILSKHSDSNLDDSFLTTDNPPKTSLTSFNTAWVLPCGAPVSVWFNDSGKKQGLWVPRPMSKRYGVAVWQAGFKFKGDKKKDGLGCYPKRSTLLRIVFGFIVLVVPCSLWIFRRIKQKEVVKLRRNLFIRNGGKLLEAMQSNQKTLSIFTAEDLKKATNNYDENNVLGQEQHFGITYKGILHEVSQIVTIKSCHASFDQCHIEVLIRKLVSLSQFGHRNVVKLLGCCLETQIPLVVYEFISVKSLLDYITDDNLARSLSWDIRLRIAADTAEALASMHSAASLPIIHGSLNSSSILLDHGFAVKVNGFSVTCLECSCVQFYDGMSGFLDPDYYLSSRLTEKSDVYSFGSILAELLTGKDVMSPEWLEGEGDLAKYFFGSSGGGDLLMILDDRVVIDGYFGQLTGVAEIAKLCLSSSSQERPTMKEVATALECIIIRNS